MNEDDRIGYQIRQILNQGTKQLDSRVAARLHEARQRALARHHVEVRGLRLAGVGHFAADHLLHRGRMFVAIVALLLGAVGAYYWQQFQQAAENEEIDSALLADELPPAAYIDRGFHAWLERSAPSSSQ